MRFWKWEIRRYDPRSAQEVWCEELYEWHVDREQIQADFYAAWDATLDRILERRCECWQCRTRDWDRSIRPLRKELCAD